tara:strand:- start:130 stop:879 length:750 start_codon:yes stop_codon:yes gene_type:complete
MKSIILAAGKGTRLGELTSNNPKCLVKLNGIPLLEYQLKIFEECEIDEIIIVAGYKSNKLNYLSKNIILNSKFNSTNMLYSLYCALDKINGDVLISYGDSVFDKSIVENMIHSKEDISVASDLRWKEYWSSRYIDPLSDLESFQVNEKGYIEQLGEKASSFDQIQGQYIGFIRLNSKGAQIFRRELKYFFTKKIINEKLFKDAYLTDFLQALITKGIKLKAIEIEGNYIEIDTIEDLESIITKQRVLTF